MRSRKFCDLTNYEIEEYLKQNDIIIVPVGHCETSGGRPVTNEYIASLAWAKLIAEEVDGLILPNVTFTSAGGTETGRGTVHMNPVDSFYHTLALAHSLLNQGFKRQVWIPSHGPTMAFLPGMVQQFFVETKVSALYLDVCYYLQQIGAMKPRQFMVKNPEPLKTQDGKILNHMDDRLGAYKICNCLDTFPAKEDVDFPPVEYKSNFENLAPWYLDSESELCFHTTGIVSTPIFFEYTRQHGGEPIALYNRKELEEHASVGEQYLREIAADGRFKELLNGLKKLNAYMQESAIPKNVDHLPKNRFSPVM